MLRYAGLRATPVVIAALALVACSADKATDSTQAGADRFTTPASTTQSEGSQTSSQMAVKAYVDPATGELRDPTPAELAAEASADKRGNANTPQENKTSLEIIRPDGSVEVVLDPSSAHPLQGCLQKDGSVKMDHDCKSDVSDTK